MKIFITNLTQYNQGRLIGQWLKLPCTEEETQTTISQVLCLNEQSELALNEEYFITDHEDIPFEVNEYDDPFKINEKLEEYEALDSPERLSVSFLLSGGYGFKYAIEHQEEVIRYPGERLEDVAYLLVEEGCFGTIPESLSNYIDFKAITKDLELDGYVETEEGVFYHAE